MKAQIGNFQREVEEQDYLEEFIELAVEDFHLMS